MDKFTAFDTEAEVMGTPVLAFQAAVELLEGDPTEALEIHGLLDISADDWVSQQDYLNMLRYFSEHNSNSLSLVAVGMKIPEKIAWPDTISALSEAFKVFEKIYQRAHRNGEVGNYSMKEIGPHHIQVIADNPYPSDFDYGIIVGISRKFSPEGVNAMVTRADSPSRLQGDDYCVFDIIW